METYYQVTTPSHTYHAIVFKEAEDGGSITRVRFGAKDYCVTFSVYDDDPNLDSLGKGDDCAFPNPSLETVPSSYTVHLAKSAIKFIYTLLKGQKTLLFKDTSEITCNKGLEISLAKHYLAKAQGDLVRSQIGSQTCAQGASSHP
jgi:hypothetical protein